MFLVTFSGFAVFITPNKCIYGVCTIPVARRLHAHVQHWVRRYEQGYKITAPQWVQDAFLQMWKNVYSPEERGLHNA